jgi:frataxin-like iron-binding protein CyaY
MNNSERIMNIDDTLKYLTEKINLSKPKCDCKNECNDCVCNHEEDQPHFWNT